MEIKIGRKVTGDNVIVIPEEFKKVSRFHATLIYSENDCRLYVRDESSANGTYIKDCGNPVAQREIRQGDILLLGGPEENPLVFRMTYGEIMRKIKGESYPIKPLREVYEQYDAEVRKLKEKARKKAARQRIIIMSVGILIFSLVGVWAENVKGIGGFGMIVSVVAGILVKPAELKEELVEINLKYRHEYRCPNPKCGREYYLDQNTHHWKMIKDGGCPFCHARFNDE